MIFSVPSYVIPGTYAENLDFLKDKAAVQGVELLFFYYDPEVRGLLLQELQVIKAYGQRFYFTLHLPDVLKAEHEELIEITNEFVHSYVVHPNEDLISFLPRWRKLYGDRFYLENTRSLSAFETVLKQFENMPICADVGHLALQKESLEAFILKHENSIKEIHLHGVVNEKDHKPLIGTESWLKPLRNYLTSFDGVVEQEVFSYAEVEQIQTILAAF